MIASIARLVAGPSRTGGGAGHGGGVPRDRAPRRPPGPGLAGPPPASPRGGGGAARDRAQPARAGPGGGGGGGARRGGGVVPPPAGSEAPAGRLVPAGAFP